MTEGQFMEILQQTIWIILLLSAPVLITSLVVGVGISVVQTITQIQEATLTFVPKILACLLVVILTGPWMVSLISNHTEQLFNSLVRWAH